MVTDYDKLWYALVASLVQRTGVKLQSDDGKNDDGKQHQQADLKQRCHSLDDGLQHDLQTYWAGKTALIPGFLDGRDPLYYT